MIQAAPRGSSWVLVAVRIGLIVTLAGTASQASMLDPGETISLNGTTLSQTPSLAGTVVADTTVSFQLLPGPPPFFNFPPPAFSGEVQELVVRESATNTLDFYYQITLDPSSEIVSPAFGTEFFGTTDLQLTTDVDFLSDSQGVGGTGVTARRLDGRQLISFLVGEPDVTGSPISAGESSQEFFIRTNATEFGVGGMVYVDYFGEGNDGSIAMAGFQPEFTPETDTAELMTIGLCALAAVCLLKGPGVLRHESSR